MNARVHLRAAEGVEVSPLKGESLSPDPDPVRCVDPCGSAIIEENTNKPATQTETQTSRSSAAVSFSFNTEKIKIK